MYIKVRSSSCGCDLPWFSKECHDLAHVVVKLFSLSSCSVAFFLSLRTRQGVGHNWYQKCTIMSVSKELHEADLILIQLALYRMAERVILHDGSNHSISREGHNAK